MQRAPFTFLSLLASGGAALLACNAVLGNHLDSADSPAVGDDGATSTTDGSRDGDLDADGATDLPALRKYPAAVMADHPVGYWRLGDRPDSSTALDESGKGMHGVYVACTLGEQGAVSGDPNTAATLFGVSSKVILPKAFGYPGTAPFTVEVWAKPRVANADYVHLFTKESYDGARQGYALVISSTKGFMFERYVDGVSANIILDPRPVVGAYSHVVGTYGPSGLDLYVNGVHAGNAPDTRPLAAQTDAAALIGIADNGKYSFDGAIDEVAVYDYVLAPAQIAAHYRAATP